MKNDRREFEEFLLFGCTTVKVPSDMSDEELGKLIMEADAFGRTETCNVEEVMERWGHILTEDQINLIKEEWGIE